MPAIHFDRYYRYAELTALVQAYAAEYPQLVELGTLGKSHEGRSIWLLTLTNQASGPAREKPAVWIDGNIHATEVSASSACLYLIEQLVQGYGSDPEVTRALDTRAFYVCPRVNPDGAEWALADKPKVVRSGTRPYPFNEEPIGGLVAEDVDGDGRLLTMRVRDPHGAWKRCPEDPRLLVRREPTETGGEYYRVLPEGRLENYDGALISMRPRKENLDFNRNFPSKWRLEHEQPGAGPFPASEPEVHAMLQFITGHLNITGALTFHTFGGVLLRPYSDQSDESFAAEDLWTYQKIGKRGTELTGYPNVSVYHDFRYHPKEVITGAFDDWMFDHLGVFAWTIELWSPQRQAGIKEYKFIEWWREHSLAEELQLLRWSDEKLGGQGFVDWYPFEHPELGPIELGGWDVLHAWVNPPGPLIENELRPFPAWVLWHALISPRLELLEAGAKPLGGGAYRVRVVVQNSGWLPAYVTKRALERKVVRGVIAEIGLPAGVTLETGRPREELGQLEGRAYKSAAPHWPDDVTDDRARCEWVVRGSAGSVVDVVVRHERAGTVRVKIVLK